MLIGTINKQLLASYLNFTLGHYPKLKYALKASVKMQTATAEIQDEKTDIGKK